MMEKNNEMNSMTKKLTPEQQENVKQFKEWLVNNSMPTDSPFLFEIKSKNEMNAMKVHVEGKIVNTTENGYPVEKRKLIVNGIELDLQDSLKIAQHSPGGFHWGYGGSGPAQSALAILLAVKGKDFAVAHYQEFKRRFIAQLDMNQDFDGQVDIELLSMAKPR